MTTNNVCGGCTACCVVLPILEPDLHKPAGEPCRHLGGKGCSIYGTPGWPQVCRDYLCGWRTHPWFNGKRFYRPDQLGVLFQFNEVAATPAGYGPALCCYETRPGAFETERFRYVKGKVGAGWFIKLYPFGVLDGMGQGLTAADNDRGIVQCDPERYGWSVLSETEIMLYRKDGRVPLPLVG
jgi:hypothetical protein